MGSQNNSKRNAKAAILNKIFYDLAADIYEEADGRRKKIPHWLFKNIEATWGHTFLDLGAGTGYAAKVALFSYKNVYAMDISMKMLDQIYSPNIKKVEHDASKPWPFSEDFKFSKIAAISTLHHIPDFCQVIDHMDNHMNEYGVFYSDLDLDDAFGKLWRIPLWIYRLFRQAGKKYKKLQPALSEDLHDAVEVHSQGIPTLKIKEHLHKKGYAVKVIYHWGNYVPFPRGLAPYVSFWAVKKRIKRGG